MHGPINIKKNYLLSSGPTKSGPQQTIPLCAKEVSSGAERPRGFQGAYKDQLAFILIARSLRYNDSFHWQSYWPKFRKTLMSEILTNSYARPLNILIICCRPYLDLNFSSSPQSSISRLAFFSASTIYWPKYFKPVY